MSRQPTEARVAIGFVVYGPTPSLRERIQLALDAGLSVFIFDNSPDQGDTREFCEACARCNYATCGNNVGLGIGLSAIAAQAYYRGFRALMFFDQDTVFSRETLAFVQRYYAHNSALEARYSAIAFNAKDIAVGAAAEAGRLKSILMTISSGSLFFLENLRRIGWHNRTYFVDCVDYEFCLRSSNHGLAIGEYRLTPGFDHLTEQPDTKARVFGKDWMVRKYSAHRIYDTLVASARLLLTAIRTGNWNFFFALARSVLIYATFQVVARFVDSKPRNTT